MNSAVIFYKIKPINKKDKINYPTLTNLLKLCNNIEWFLLQIFSFKSNISGYGEPPAREAPLGAPLLKKV
jgi:hypothetical protein